MFNKPQEIIVLSMGGSLIIPNGGLDLQFLKKLNSFIREQIKYNRRFLITIGGGKTARDYRDAGKAVIGELKNDDLDWIGIHATRLNAHLVRTIFQDIAHPRIIENYDHKLVNWNEPIAIGAGWKPGWSTDYCAVLLARDYKASVIINLSNTDWVYDKDPHKFKNAKIIKKTTWDFFETLTGDKWIPGMNMPFDPIASKLAKKLGLTVITTNGRNFSNIKNILKGENFKGTVITPFIFDSSFYDRDYFEGKKEGRTKYVEPFLRGFIAYAVNWYRAVWIKLMLNPKNCLDAGCGTGGLVANLRILGIEASGIDVSEYALESAPKDIKPYLTKGSITDIPFDDNTFDLVFSFNVLEHIERSKLKKATEESIRVSRKWIVHKIYTIDNSLVRLIKGKQFAQVSVLSRSFWVNMFKEDDNVAIVRRSFFHLPSFLETLFLLKKK